MMDDYEQDVARQPKGPFTRVKERQLIRRSAEHWWERQRYTAETKRRAKAWAFWIGLFGPGAFAAIKWVESLILGKGSP